MFCENLGPFVQEIKELTLWASQGPRLGPKKRILGSTPPFLGQIKKFQKIIIFYQQIHDFKPRSPRKSKFFSMLGLALNPLTTNVHFRYNFLFQIAIIIFFGIAGPKFKLD